MRGTYTYLTAQIVNSLLNINHRYLLIYQVFSNYLNPLVLTLFLGMLRFHNQRSNCKPQNGSLHSTFDCRKY